jgi:hypothetical protein
MLFDMNSGLGAGSSMGKKTESVVRTALYEGNGDAL